MNWHFEPLEGEFAHLYRPPALTNALMPEVALLSPDELLSELRKLLIRTISPGWTWTLSWIGPLSWGQNLGTLAQMGRMPGRFAFSLPETVVDELGGGPPLVELSFSGDVPDLQTLLAWAELSPNWETVVGGWLVPIAARKWGLRNSRFENGRFRIPSADIQLSFCTAREFTSLVVMAPEQEKLNHILEISRYDEEG